MPLYSCRHFKRRHRAPDARAAAVYFADRLATRRLGKRGMCWRLVDVIDHGARIDITAHLRRDRHTRDGRIWTEGQDVTFSIHQEPDHG